MKHSIGILVCLVAQAAFAGELEQGRVQSVVAPSDARLTEVALDNGRMIYLDPTDTRSIARLQDAMARGETLEIEVETLRDSDRLVSVKSLGVIPSSPADEMGNGVERFDFDFSSDFEASTYNTLDEVNRIFSSQRNDFRSRSICANRAQTWSYELDTQYGVKTMKVFLFWTPAYNRTYRHKWWYHVSPFVYMNGADGKKHEVVIDRTFERTPLEMDKWVSDFSNLPCATIDNYQQFVDNAGTTACYLRKVSMYYWMPITIQNADAGGSAPMGWNMGEVNSARRQAL